MTFKIILSVVIGIGSGYFFFDQSILPYTSTIVDMGLCLLLLFVGIDIGRNKSAFNKIKNMGFKILLVPIMVMLGTLVGSCIGGFFLGLPVNESSAIGAGFGWYTLSSILLVDYSSELSALAFISNVVREIMALILIPIVAKYMGDLEAIGPAGATAMDTSLPIISNSTNSKTSIIAFITGVIISSCVPILVPILINM
ncbi:MAG: lysine exporter LysO family protein [Anaeromicrobium sp.]|jgi:uncharacterized membrane protein YbjE (DUF340 family)|uniref:lysine exporter LysO family protein n=1 Tax=Anaeromicrobium sp. TaxID=1929132 RepID=UPI0025FB5CD3|nr:lysine exporter LysO family protein [Anaeromicrobium sp.]MCT4595838.1 lysine exporter LysO family protein [Anaeromicrobium sp.]